MQKERESILETSQNIDLLPVDDLIETSTWRRITGEEPRKTHFHVIIPARNEEVVIARILRNIVTQKIPDSSSLTIDVVSNGTTDNTEEELRKVQKELFKKQEYGLASSTIDIRYFYLDEPGKTVALNFGKRAALSDIIINIDADTLPTSNSLAKVYASIRYHPNCVAASIMPRRLKDSKVSSMLGGMQDYYDAITQENGAIIGKLYAYRKIFFGDFPEDTMSNDTWLEFTAIDKYGLESVIFLGQKANSDVAVYYTPTADIGEYLSQLIRWESGFQYLIKTYPELEEACYLANRVKQPRGFINVFNSLKEKYPDIPLRDKLMMFYLLKLVRRITKGKFMIEKFGHRSAWTSPKSDRLP